MAAAAVHHGAMLATMAAADPKAELHRYLQVARDALLWKLDGLSEYDVRRPMVPTGTNLLGLVKHVASVEAGYFGDTFGRPFPEPLPWFDDDAEPNADMWATAERVARQTSSGSTTGCGRTPTPRSSALRARRHRPRAVVAGGAQRGDAAPRSWST